MTIIVHIGPPKTATTTIQKALEFNNDNVLNDNNAQYIISSKCKKDILFFVAHIDAPLPRKFNQPDSFKPEVYKKDAELFFERLKKSYKKSNIYLSSSEYLFRLSIEEIKSLKKKLSDIDNDIEIICFIRDPISRNLSRMAENIKNKTVLRDPSIYVNTYDQINAWEGVFGLNFHVYSFDSAVKEEAGIVGYFSNCINKILIEKGIKTNISLDSYRDTQNISPCTELLKATHQYRIKYKLKDNVYSKSLNYARNQISELAEGLGTKMDYSEVARTFFINENKNLYELLENKYNFKFKYKWKNYIDKENFKNLRNTTWNFDNIIKNYNEDLAKLFLIYLEQSINNRDFQNQKVNLKNSKDNLLKRSKLKLKEKNKVIEKLRNQKKKRSKYKERFKMIKNINKMFKKKIKKLIEKN